MGPGNDGKRAKSKTRSSASCAHFDAANCTWRIALTPEHADTRGQWGGRSFASTTAGLITEAL
jgi:hypothetical protein